MIIKEMKYETKKHEPYILASGEYRKHKYYVLSFGVYPTAYVSVEIDTREMKWEDIETLFDKCPIHGGVTYAQSGLPNDKLDESVNDISFIGWDYAHIGDYEGDIGYYSNAINRKKWTTEEIIKECKEVIDKIEPNYYTKSAVSTADYKNEFNFNPNIRYGWICPRCGKVNSPNTRSCDCGGDTTVYAYGGTVTNEYKVVPKSDISTTANDNSVIRLHTYTTARNNK